MLSQGYLLYLFLHLSIIKYNRMKYLVYLAMHVGKCRQSCNHHHNQDNSKIKKNFLLLSFGNQSHYLHQVLTKYNFSEFHSSFFLNNFLILNYI